MHFPYLRQITWRYEIDALRSSTRGRSGRYRLQGSSLQRKRVKLFARSSQTVSIIQPRLQACICVSLLCSKNANFSLNSSSIAALVLSMSLKHLSNFLSDRVRHVSDLSDGTVWLS